MLLFLLRVFGVVCARACACVVRFISFHFILFRQFWLLSMSLCGLLYQFRFLFLLCSSLYSIYRWRYCQRSLFLSTNISPIPIESMSTTYIHFTTIYVYNFSEIVLNACTFLTSKAQFWFAEDFCCIYFFFPRLSIHLCCRFQFLLPHHDQFDCGCNCNYNYDAWCIETYHISHEFINSAKFFINWSYQSISIKNWLNIRSQRLNFIATHYFVQIAPKEHSQRSIHFIGIKCIYRTGDKTRATVLNKSYTLHCFCCFLLFFCFVLLFFGFTMYTFWMVCPATERILHADGWMDGYWL